MTPDLRLMTPDLGLENPDLLDCRPLTFDWRPLTLDCRPVLMFCMCQVDQMGEGGQGLICQVILYASIYSICTHHTLLLKSESAPHLATMSVCYNDENVLDI